MRTVVKAKMPTPEKRAATDLVIRNLDKARVALSEAKTAQETKQVVHLARAMEVFAKQEKLSEECRKHAYSIWIEAMRQLGLKARAK